jgi:hypothetical protein
VAHQSADNIFCVSTPHTCRVSVGQKVTCLLPVVAMSPVVHLLAPWCTHDGGVMHQPDVTIPYLRWLLPPVQQLATAVMSLPRPDLHPATCLLPASQADPARPAPEPGPEGVAVPAPLLPVLRPKPLLPRWVGDGELVVT